MIVFRFDVVINENCLKAILLRSNDILKRHQWELLLQMSTTDNDNFYLSKSF